MRQDQAGSSEEHRTPYDDIIKLINQVRAGR
jgi:hypothetical protein